MSKFNRPTLRPAAPSVITATGPALTFEGGTGYSRETKSDLFLLAVANFVGEDTFYEKASDRDERYAELVHKATAADPTWTAAFLGWLRTGAYMRSASIVGAAEFTAERLRLGQPGLSRQVIASVLQRADEPGEFIAYWTSRYGRSLPQPVKRGIADAVARLYTEYALLKYDTASHAVRFADVLELTHPKPIFRLPEIDEASAPVDADEMGEWLEWRTGERAEIEARRSATLSALFRYALDRRHGREDDPELLNALPMVTANSAIRLYAQTAKPRLTTERLRAAGMTWEDALSLAGDKYDKAELWEALIPTMGIMALLRNLRNFDEAGVSDEVAAGVCARFTDPQEIARSRQFPYRFLAAYEAAPSLRWGQALDTALGHSLSNVPALPGRTLILVDTSASMTTVGFSARSKMTPAKAAAIFGVTLAKRSGADLYGFANGTFRHPVLAGSSVIREVERFVARTGAVGHGTEIAASLRATYAGHDRVFIISDGQTFLDRLGEVTTAVPAHIPMYGYNLGGYATTTVKAGAPNRHEFGALNDSAFKVIPLLERGTVGNWPWEESPR